MEELLGIVAAALGLAETEVTETLESEGGAGKITALLDKSYDDAKNAADGRATKKTRTEVEKAFKNRGVDFKFDEKKSFDLNVAAAVEALETKLSATPGDAPNALTEQQILNLPFVKKLKNDHTLELDRKVQEAEEKVKNDLKSEREKFEQEQIEIDAREFIRKQLATLNPNVGDDDPELAANRLKRLENDIYKAGNWKKDGKELVLYDAEGNILTDDSGKVIKPEMLVREETTSLYKLPVSTPKTSTGHTQPAPASGSQEAPKHYKGELPKNATEYAAKMADATISNDAKVEMKELYQAAQKEK